MNFERGGDPKDALKIGKKFRKIEKGDKFTVEFRLRRSCPEFYPLQKQKIIIVKAIEDEQSAQWDLTPEEDCSKTVKVVIPNHPERPNVFGHFHADYLRTAQKWVIG